MASLFGSSGRVFLLLSTTGATGCTAEVGLNPLVLFGSQPGDKVMKISASFGADVWEAKNYGQVNEMQGFSGVQTTR